MSDQHTDDFLTVCRSFDQAMLVTHAANDQLVARPMVVAELENDGDLWFATDHDSGKVDEILAKPGVCVTMAGNGKYASISGRAEIINDHRKVEALWNEAWRVWFPDGPQDPRLVLIKVHAIEGEFWSNSGTNRIKYLFQAAKAYMNGDRPETLNDSSQHAHVDLNKS